MDLEDFYNNTVIQTERIPYLSVAAGGAALGRRVVHRGEEVEEVEEVSGVGRSVELRSG